MAKKRQLACYIAPGMNAPAYEDFVTSPDASKRRRTAEAAKRPAQGSAVVISSTLHDVAVRVREQVREQAGIASETIAASAAAASAAAATARQKLGTAWRMAEEEADAALALADPVIDAVAAAACSNAGAEGWRVWLPRRETELQRAVQGVCHA